jgi:predicted HicB family RNase H-like nuclease
MGQMDKRKVFNLKLDAKFHHKMKILSVQLGISLNDLITQILIDHFRENPSFDISKRKPGK